MSPILFPIMFYIRTYFKLISNKIDTRGSCKIIFHKDLVYRPCVESGLPPLGMGLNVSRQSCRNTTQGLQSYMHFHAFQVFLPDFQTCNSSTDTMFGGRRCSMQGGISTQCIAVCTLTSQAKTHPVNIWIFPNVRQIIEVHKITVEYNLFGK